VRAAVTSELRYSYRTDSLSVVCELSRTLACYIYALRQTIWLGNRPRSALCSVSPTGDNLSLQILTPTFADKI